MKKLDNQPEPSNLEIIMKTNLKYGVGMLIFILLCAGASFLYLWAQSG